MANNVCMRNLTPVGIIAGISSGVQGLVGAVLSICAICAYFCAISPGDDATFSQYLLYFFQGRKCGSNTSLNAIESNLSPGVIVIWMFLSLFFNLVLHIASVCLVLALWKWKKEKTIYVVNTWTFVSILTFIDDILLTYVFSDIYYYTGSKEAAPPFQKFTCLVVVFFALRGLFCLLANLSFIVFMVNASTDLMKDLRRKNKQESSQQEFIRSWPSLNTIQNGHASINRNENSSTLPPITNAFPESRPYVRTPSMYGSQFPEYSALGRWPSLAFNPSAQTVKERSNRNLMRPMIEQERQSRSLRSYAMTNNNHPPPLPLEYVRRNRSSPDGIENKGFLGSQELRDRFIRLQSDSGSEPYDPEIPPYPQDYSMPPPPPLNKSELYDSDFIFESVDGRKFETNTLRPKSLQEAILTRPPLKPVTVRGRKNSSSNV